MDISSLNNKRTKKIYGSLLTHHELHNMNTSNHLYVQINVCHENNKVSWYQQFI